ncbi:hypothetical protein ETH_00000615 [Eimeria tenella]|uniref:Uncharacterized protein n=1 Tax=Eimeria tenella TaxID=5802 RepID=U6L4V8_EIMTE|nr:hypothetical protein ETH_00000615 [Eimeria tenella]CDJ44248.1 hypothetical protein ETH_00000615 [Eimeria tenella]|eukprot:XP_013234997.1 hypothetical protein ETH_00000615 [Eimeria tenella]
MANCLPQLLLLLKEQHEKVLQAEAAEAQVAAHHSQQQAAAAADGALQQQEQQQEQQQQQLVAAKAAKKQQRSEELLLVTVLHGCLLLHAPDAQQQQQLQQQQQHHQLLLLLLQQQQQKQQMQLPPGYSAVALKEWIPQLVQTFCCLSGSKSEGERTLLAEALVHLQLCFPCCSSSSNSSSCSSSSCCCICEAVHGFLNGATPEEKLTGLAVVREGAARSVKFNKSLKSGFLACLTAEDLRVRRLAVTTLGCMYTSTLSALWGLPAETETLAAHLLQALELEKI